MSETAGRRCFELVDLDGGLVDLRFDHPDRDLNVLDERALEDLEKALDEIEKREGLAGVLVTSGKESGFCAGADVTRMASCWDAAWAQAMSRRGQAAFGRLERLAVPVIAAVDGPCLGGGLELALACDRIVATRRASTRLALPETRLGIVPAFGGTQRLPRRVGLPAALDLVLTGRGVSGAKALALGLVDDVVEDRWVLPRAARAWALGEVPSPPRRSLRSRALARLLSSPPARALVLARARRSVERRSRGLYPALPAAIELLELAVTDRTGAGYEKEAEWVGRLLAGATAHHLIDLFLDTRRLSERGRRAAERRKPRRLGVVGGGVMGAGIAARALRSGMEVRLKEIDTAALARSVSAVAQAVRRRRPRHEATRALDRFWPSCEWTGFGRLDLVVEAVVERVEVKREVFARLERITPPDAALCTNTSSLPLGEIATALSRPERFLGLHFFNPVDRMPLVEIVRMPATSDAVLDRAHAVAAELGKTPVEVADGPGFLVNRVLARTFAEALLLIEEGRTPDEIDEALLEYGFAMGPVAVLDLVGLDVAEAAARRLAASMGERLPRSALAARLVERGALGRKSGNGLRRGGRSRGPLSAPAREALRSLGSARPTAIGPNGGIRDRLLMPLFDESVRAFDDGVVTDARDLDTALVLGAGFPPARRGPLTEIDRIGVAAVVERMTALERACGGRFAPGEGLRTRARAGRQARERIDGANTGGAGGSGS